VNLDTVSLESPWLLEVLNSNLSPGLVTDTGNLVLSLSTRSQGDPLGPGMGDWEAGTFKAALQLPDVNVCSIATGKQARVPCLCCTLPSLHFHRTRAQQGYFCYLSLDG
jgi:hypothetical protein